MSTVVLKTGFITDLWKQLRRFCTSLVDLATSLSSFMMNHFNRLAIVLRFIHPNVANSESSDCPLITHHRLEYDGTFWPALCRQTECRVLRSCDA